LSTKEASSLSDILELSFVRVEPQDVLPRSETYQVWMGFCLGPIEVLKKEIKSNIRELKIL